MFVRILALVTMVGLGASANAAVMGFEAGVGNPLSLTESGMTVTSQYAPGPGHLHFADSNSDGSNELFNHTGCCSTPYRFEIGGGAFNLTSIDFISALTGTFTSSAGGNINVGVAGTFAFGADFSGITWLEWESDGNNYIDNLTFNTNVAAIPEPSTWVLFGVGLMGLVAVRRRNKKSA